MNSIEHSFVMIKPDGMDRGLAGVVIQRLERIGLRLVAAQVCSPTREHFEQHYQVEKLAPIVGQKSKDAGTDLGTMSVEEYGRMVLDWNAQYMMSGPVLAMVWSGRPGTVARIRSIVGATNPLKAAPGTIRGDYGIDDIDTANSERRGCATIVHASGDPDEASYEVQLWFPNLKVDVR